MLTVQNSRTEERWLCEMHVYHNDGNNEETEKQPRSTASSLDHILNTVTHFGVLKGLN